MTPNAARRPLKASVIAPRIKVTKLEFRAALTTIFPGLTDAQVDRCWAQLRAEVTVEEIQDAFGPIYTLATSVVRRREDSARRYGGRHGRL